MSQEQPMTQNAIPAQQQISVRVNRMKRAPAFNIIGLPELIGLAGAALLALLTLFAWFYFYLPAKSRFTSTQMEKQRFLSMRAASGSELQTGLSTQTRVNQIKASLEDFEGNWLPSQSSGRMSLYTVLNKLIKSNGLRNTAGPAYSPLAAVGTKTQVQATVSAEKQSQAKWQSIYPGIVVSVTVEGPYQNVRHFVHDIEASRQFLIINAVELERVTQSGTAEAPPVAVPARATGSPAPTAGGRGTLVSLRMDMATYFQRTDSNPNQ
jgi:Type II secretion system (T2SS), protein M subtype b